MDTHTVQMKRDKRRLQRIRKRDEARVEQAKAKAKFARIAEAGRANARKVKAKPTRKPLDLRGYTGSNMMDWDYQ